MAFSIIDHFLSPLIDACIEKKSFERLSALLLKKSTIMLNKLDFRVLR